VFRWGELLGDALRKGDECQLAQCVLAHPASKLLKRETISEIFAWSLGVKPSEKGRTMLKQIAEAMLSEEL